MYVADLGNHRVDPAVLLDDVDFVESTVSAKDLNCTWWWVTSEDEQQANHYIGKALQLSLNSEQLLFTGQGESLETQDV